MSPMPRPPASRLEQLLRARQFVITAELAPPVSCDAGDLLRKALPLRGLADAVNVTDGASARAHLSAPIAAALLAREGIEPILQLTCRDRNRIALQADLMGAAASGVNNILLLTGDDPKAGDQPETKPVFDVDSTTLTAMARDLRDKGELPSGRKVGGPGELLSRRRRRADRSAARLEAGQARRQDRRRRRLRPDAVLHGCRDRPALCGAPGRARGDARLFPADRHRAVALGQIGALDEGAICSGPSFPTPSSSAWSKPAIPRRGPAHRHRADRGARDHPGRRRRPRHGAGQRGGGAAR